MPNTVLMALRIRLQICTAAVLNVFLIHQKRRNQQA
jgi:hypothetical protein